MMIAAALAASCALGAPGAKRDPAVVRDYIRKAVGDRTLSDIGRQEGGAAFLKRFLSDAEWMEEFAGSGPWKGDAASALRALDLLAWNDQGDFIGTKLGRNAATALALNHGFDFSPEKLVEIMECYREWERDGTLHVSSKNLDTRQWREIMTFGQNAELGVDSLRWIHDFATLPAARYGGLPWTCEYRLKNCFGDSVHGPMYYAPWQHSWNTQELRHRVGGVCGALSKFGSHGAASHGIRSFTAGQPGHCAYMLWDFDKNRWGLSYSVTGHTGSHFSLGEEYCLAANEEQDRYYTNPKRMDAEYLRWKGEYAKSMALVHGNWHAAKDWQDSLAERGAPRQEWDKYAAAVRDTFKEAPYQGWRLYFAYLERIGAADRLEAAKQGLLAFRESPAETVEPMHFEEKVLDPLMKIVGDDRETAWKLFPYMLKGQANTKNYFNMTIDWAAGRLMASPEDTKRFLSVVEAASAKGGANLDYGGMVLKASRDGDLAVFRQVYSLLDKLSPGGKPSKAAPGKWPSRAYGGDLLSPDGMLRTSTTSDYDTPVKYRDVLDAGDYEGSSGFHTAKETSPWAEVVLPGESEVSGVTVANAGGRQNGGRQVPLRIWTSMDGKDYRQVYESGSAQDAWECRLQPSVRAKYVRVGREPDAREEFFHLKKILVYGKKLY